MWTVIWGAEGMCLEMNRDYSASLNSAAALSVPWACVMSSCWFAFWSWSAAQSGGLSLTASKWQTVQNSAVKNHPQASAPLTQPAVLSISKAVFPHPFTCSLFCYRDVFCSSIDPFGSMRQPMWNELQNNSEGDGGRPSAGSRPLKQRHTRVCVRVCTLSSEGI